MAFKAGNRSRSRGFCHAIKFLLPEKLTVNPNEASCSFVVCSPVWGKARQAKQQLEGKQENLEIAII